MVFNSAYNSHTNGTITSAEKKRYGLYSVWTTFKLVSRCSMDSWSGSTAISVCRFGRKRRANWNSRFPFPVPIATHDLTQLNLAAQFIQSTFVHDVVVLRPACCEQRSMVATADAIFT